MPETTMDDDAFFDAIAETQLAVQRAHAAWLDELSRRQVLKEMGLDDTHLAIPRHDADGFDLEAPDWRSHRAFARRGRPCPPGPLSIKVTVQDQADCLALLILLGDASSPDRPAMS